MLHKLKYYDIYYVCYDVSKSYICIAKYHSYFGSYSKIVSNEILKLCNSQQVIVMLYLPFHNIMDFNMYNFISENYFEVVPNPPWGHGTRHENTAPSMKYRSGPWKINCKTLSEAI